MKTESGHTPVFAVPKPRITWRGVAIAAVVWVLYSFLSTVPLMSTVAIPFSWALTGQLIQHAVMGLLSIPAWLIVVRWMDPVKWRWKLAAHLVIGSAYAFINYEIYFQFVLFSSKGAAGKAVANVSSWITTWNFLLYVLQFAFYHGAIILQRLWLKEQQALELLALNREQELAALKAQINPHFFFNTLNSISAMASRDPEETRVMIAQLGDLLRYAIDISKRDFVPLREEVEFTKAYLALESKRFSDRLQVEYNIAEKALTCLIPPMVIQPLVENAIKHGIEPSEQGGKVVVNVSVDGRNASVSVRDTGVGFQGTTLTAPGNGIGLSNTDARLRKLYGKTSGLWTNVSAGGGFEVGFTLPMKLQSEG